MGREIVWDVETDNLYPMLTQAWVVVLKSLCGEVDEKIYPFRAKGRGSYEFMDILKDGDILIGHNILGYDFFAIMKTMGVFYNVQTGEVRAASEWGRKDLCKKIKVVDTLCLSRFLAPDQVAHSLAHYGKMFGNRKIDFHEFEKFSEEMVVYCDQDVNLNIIVYKFLMKKYLEMYGVVDLPESFEAYQYDYYLMTAQGFTGVKYNLKKGEKTEVLAAHLMEEIRAVVEPQLPSRPMLKGEEKTYTMPKKPFKKDGTTSAASTKFVEKMVNLGHTCELVCENGEYDIIFDGDRYMLKSEFVLPLRMPMKLGNQAHMKDWFLHLGWKPTFWNWKKDSDGQLLRQNGRLVPNTPKLQEMGKLCPNLELIDTDIAKDVVKWLSLRNRHSVVGNWNTNPRLDVDGRLSATISGTTPTYRYKHSNVVNVPKAAKNVLLGKEFRSLFCAPDGKVFVGADASGLEGRCEAHYTKKHDGGVRANVILNGDIHSHNAKIFFPKETAGFDLDAPDFDKEHPEFKPWRSKSKNAAYALAYGCGVKKLAETLGKPEREAQSLYDAFWDGNPSLKSVKEACELYWTKVGGKKYMLGIDGRLVTTRKKSALVNSLFQSCGAIIMSYACLLVDKKLGGLFFDQDWLPYYRYKGHRCKRVLFVHDELQFESDPEIADEVGQIVVDSIKEAGEMLGIRVPLDGEYGIGDSWAETH